MAALTTLSQQLPGFCGLHHVKLTAPGSNARRQVLQGALLQSATASVVSWAQYLRHASLYVLDHTHPHQLLQVMRPSMLTHVQSMAHAAKQCLSMPKVTAWPLPHSDRAAWKEALAAYEGKSLAWEASHYLRIADLEALVMPVVAGLAAVERTAAQFVRVGGAVEAVQHIVTQLAAVGKGREVLKEVAATVMRDVELEHFGAEPDWYTLAKDELESGQEGLEFHHQSPPSSTSRSSTTTGPFYASPIPPGLQYTGKHRAWVAEQLRLLGEEEAAQHVEAPLECVQRQRQQRYEQAKQRVYHDMKLEAAARSIRDAAKPRHRRRLGEGGKFTPAGSVPAPKPKFGGYIDKKGRNNE